MSGSGGIVIEARSLCFSYAGEGLIKDVGFAVNRADFVALTGSNGAGKSTLLRLILGELEPVSGGLYLFGEELKRFRDWPRVAYVPQFYPAASSAFPATALEIVNSAMYSRAERLLGLFRAPLSAALREKAKYALELTGMSGQSGKLMGELSGGQRQRVMIARALAAECELLLLDEPASGVDENAAANLYALLNGLSRKGMTILMVTHDMARAAEAVNRTLCLEQGSLVELTREDIRHELSHKHKH